MIKLAVFEKNVNIIMQVTLLCQFKSWKDCFQNEGSGYLAVTVPLDPLLP